MVTATKRRQARGELQWIDDRWHLDGRGIHAGECLEVRWPDGTWERVRIESGDSGRNLYAHFEYHGRALCVRVAARYQDVARAWQVDLDETVRLRWPERD